MNLIHARQLKEARQLVHEGLDIEELRSTDTMLFEGIALLFWKERRWEQAIELCTMACTHPYIGKSQWVADVVGKYMNEAAVDLPPDIVQAARRRGEKLDMVEAAAEVLQELRQMGWGSTHRVGTNV